MLLDHNLNVPLHVQAENMLRELIQEDDYQKGKLLPNEVELSRMMGISRNTLRQAINKLVYEGILIRKKRYGTRVAPRNVMGNALSWKSFSQEMRLLGIPVQNFELHISRKPSPEEAAKFFGVERDEPLFCLERLRGRPGHPFVYFISYFNPDIPMSVEDDMSAPLYDTLREKHGIEVKTSRELISARGATRELASKLGLAEGDPVLVRTRFVSDVDDIPVEYNIGYYRADSFTYSIEFKNG